MGELAKKQFSKLLPIINKKIESYLVALPLIKSKPKELKQKIDNLSLYLEQLAKKNPALNDLREGIQAAHLARLGLAALFSSFPLTKGREAKGK